jgi:protein-disulfide isomerase
MTIDTSSGDRITRTNGTWRARLDIATSVAMLAAAASLLWTNIGKPLMTGASRPQLPVPTRPLKLDGAQLAGSRSARVGILEYSDFQCPFCAKFAREVWPTLRSKYVDSGAVLVAFRNYPLPIHALATGAAVGATCAAGQGRFWELHDLLFQDQLHLDDAGLKRAASGAQLNIEAFEQCRQDSRAADRVRADADEAQRLRVTGTPSFFVGYLQTDGTLAVKQTMTGAQALGNFDEVISNLLKNQK